MAAPQNKTGPIPNPLPTLPLPRSATTTNDKETPAPAQLDPIPEQRATPSLTLIPKNVSTSEPAPVPALAADNNPDDSQTRNRQSNDDQTNDRQTPTRPGEQPAQNEPKLKPFAEISTETPKPASANPTLHEDSKRPTELEDAPKPAFNKASTEPLKLLDPLSTSNAPASTLTTSAPSEPRNQEAVDQPRASKPLMPALTQPPQPTTASQIAIRLDSPDATSQVELRIRERAGEVQIAVRSNDQGVATTLRQDLGDLVKRLEPHTSSPDSIHQESPAESTHQTIPHVPGGSDASRAYSYFSDDGQQQQRQRQQQQQQQQRQQRATEASPDTLDELRSVLNDLNNGVYTS